MNEDTRGTTQHMMILDANHGGFPKGNIKLHGYFGVRHGYPWVPPTRVPEVPVKWTRPARSPADLQVGPKTLSTILTTREDLGRPYPDRRRPAELVEQAFPLITVAAPLVGPRIVGYSL
jgi:hypothetical protein